MAIDYAQVLAIIVGSEDPPAALEAFVDQEREVAVHEEFLRQRPPRRPTPDHPTSPVTQPRKDT